MYIQAIYLSVSNNTVGYSKYRGVRTSGCVLVCVEGKSKEPVDSDIM